MLTKKEQRLRRSRQTRIRIATRRCASDGEPHQPAHLCQRHFRRRRQVLASASTAEEGCAQSSGAAGKGGNAAAQP
jgi:large subunit ribosomal protein L18